MIPGKLSLYNCDCIPELKKFKENHFDIAIVDPPYGIGMGGNAQIKSISNRPNWKGNKYDIKKWDNARPTKDYFDEIKLKCENQIIWGGNYFTDYLFPSKGWLVWDKNFSHNKNFSHGEIAWTSFNTILRLFKFSATGINFSQNKIHPTEKPVALYRWILKHYAYKGNKIIDTHLGSGSNAIACLDYGINFTGYEIDADYFQDIKKRIITHTELLNECFNFDLNIEDKKDSLLIGH